MFAQLRCEQLETRENPVGPLIMDPIGLPVTSPPPANVPSATPAPTPTPTTPDSAAIQRILEETMRAIALQGW